MQIQATLPYLWSQQGTFCCYTSRATPGSAPSGFCLRLVLKGHMVWYPAWGYTKAGQAQGPIYCLPQPFTFPDMGPEPHQSLQTKPKVQPAVFIPSCPSKYLTAFSKAWCVCVCVCDLAVCFMLVSEVRLVNIFINKYQTVFGLS